MKLREDLDDYMSLVCFKAAIKGMEDLLTEEGAAAAMIAAGRARGAEVAEQSGLKGANPSPEQLRDALDAALGKNGTRLCEIADVSETPDGGYLVKAKETVCMAGEADGSTRKCTYTLGAILGAIEVATNKSLSAKHDKRTLDGAETEEFLFELKS